MDPIRFTAVTIGCIVIGSAIGDCWDQAIAGAIIGAVLGVVEQIWSQWNH